MTTAEEYNVAVEVLAAKQQRIRELEARNAVLEAVREAALTLYLAAWPLSSPEEECRGDLWLALGHTLAATDPAPTEPPQESTER